MTKKLYDYDLDENVGLFLLIESCDVRVAKNGKKFLALTFQDQSGKMDGKFWDASDEDGETFKAGTIVFLKGKRELYQNQPQLKIFAMRPSQEGEGQEVSDFLESAPISKEEVMDEFNTYISKVENPNMNEIVRHVLNKYHESYFESPAAKRLHHAYPGGLSFHTLSILKLVDTVLAQYDGLNQSLLYAGAILHDLGKVKELTGPVNTAYSLQGNLIGHIVLVDEEITLTCQALEIDEEEEDVVLLKHMILAHHGLLEYGSPVRPRLIEAEILHQLDHLDASIVQISDALSRSDSGEYTERLFGMDNRSFYKPDFSSEN